MTELLKNFTFQDGTMAVCVFYVSLLLLRQAYVNITQGQFIENIEQLEDLAIYRLKTSNWFYKGIPPTINESAFHEPDTLIKPCMLLKFVSYQDEYIVFEVKTNECKKKEHKLNGKTVYYKKELFDNLDKIEIG